MHPSSIAPLVSTILFATMGLLVFLSNPRSRVHLTYALWAAGTVWWQGTWTILFNTTDPHMADILVRLGYSGIIFLPIFYYNFVVEFVGLRKEKRPLLIFLYSISVVMLVLLWTTNLFIRGHYTYSWGFYPKAGWLHPVYMTWVTYVIFECTYLPYRQSKLEKNRPMRYNQLRSLIWATLAYSLAAVDFACNYGLNIYPVGFLTIHVSAFIIGVAINRYRLIDMKLMWRTAAIYTAFAAVITLFLGSIVWTVRSTTVSTLLIFGSALLGAMFFERIRGGIGRAVDKLPPFKSQYSRFYNLQNHLRGIKDARSLDEWANQVVNAAHEIFRSAKCALLVKDPSLRAYHIQGGVGLSLGQMGFMEVAWNDPLARKLQQEGAPLIREVLESSSDTSTDLDRALKSMEEISAAVAAPLFIRGQLHAILSLDQKMDGAMYTDWDLTSLLSLMEHAEESLRVILSNLEQTEYISLWAHDLLHPLGIDGSFKYVAQATQGMFGPISQELKTALQLVFRDANFFAKHLTEIVRPIHKSIRETMDIRPAPLTGVYQRVAEKYRSALAEKGIRVQVRPPSEDVSVVCDPDMIEYRVFANLVRNALRYTPPDGTIELGHRVEGDRFIGYVKDSGIGIRKEDLPSVFKKGLQLDEANAGTAGVGLYSSSKIVEALGGRMWVDSVFGEGSTFYFELPVGAKP